MRLALLAFVLGMSLFVQSAAVLALEAGPPSTGLWWLTLLPVLTTHSVSGFVVTGGAAAFASGRGPVAAGCLAASVTITVLIALVAVYLAWRVGIEMPPTVAIFLVVVSLLASIVASLAAFQMAIVPRGRLVPRERE
jgi:hypothetical protein